METIGRVRCSLDCTRLGSESLDSMLTAPNPICKLQKIKDPKIDSYKQYPELELHIT